MELDTLKSLALKLNTCKRIRVVLPDLPNYRAYAKDPGQVFADEWEEWALRVERLWVDALCALAKERNADVNEISKVADLLLEVVPPERRGKKGKDSWPVLLLVALEVNKGKSQQVACDLAGIDPKTFRKYRIANPVGWKIAQTVVRILPENQIRESAKELPWE
jgi:hypothetical protein